jgi:hypothetical protein
VEIEKIQRENASGEFILPVGGKEGRASLEITGMFAIIKTCYR